jgi:hypothetical protein
MSRHVYIKWSYLTINDEEIDPSKEFIKLKNKNQIDAYNLFNSKYTELCNVLFSEKENDNLQLNLSKMYYLGTDSCLHKDLVLRKFFDDSSDNQEGDVKPIYLSRESYDLEVYKLFSIILSGFADYDEDFGTDFGYLSLGFDDTRGYICSDGDQQQEITVFVSEVGIRWMDWREVEDKTIELKEEATVAAILRDDIKNFVEFNSDFMNKLEDIDLESEFEYWEFLDGEDEPGLYFFPDEISQKYARLLGWNVDNTTSNFLIEISQAKIAKIQINGLHNRGCAEEDKFVLDHFLSMM